MHLIDSLILLTFAVFVDCVIIITSNALPCNLLFISVCYFFLYFLLYKFWELTILYTFSYIVSAGIPAKIKAKNI